MRMLPDLSPKVEVREALRTSASLLWLVVEDKERKSQVVAAEVFISPPARLPLFTSHKKSHTRLELRR